MRRGSLSRISVDINFRAYVSLIVGAFNRIMVEKLIGRLVMRRTETISDKRSEFGILIVVFSGVLLGLFSTIDHWGNLVIITNGIFQHIGRTRSCNCNKLLNFDIGSNTETSSRLLIQFILSCSSVEVSTSGWYLSRTLIPCHKFSEHEFSMTEEYVYLILACPIHFRWVLIPYSRSLKLSEINHAYV